MDTDRARAQLTAERAEVTTLLNDNKQAGDADRAAEAETGDIADAAQPLSAEGMDDAIAESLRDRLSAIDRALQRLAVRLSPPDQPHSLAKEFFRIVVCFGLHILRQRQRHRAAIRR